MTNPIKAIDIGIKVLRRTPAGRQVIRDYKKIGNDAANWTRSTLRSATNRAKNIEAGKTVRPLKLKPEVKPPAFPPTTTAAGARARAAAAPPKTPVAKTPPKTPVAKTTTTKGTTPTGGQTTTKTTLMPNLSRMTPAQKKAALIAGGLGTAGVLSGLAGVASKRKQRAAGTGTQKAQPRSKPNPPSALLGGQRALKNTLRGSDAPLPRSKETVDEYAEAFASPDADKMYNLSEKNRRKDMNMLERAFEDIKAGGKRASADRKKRGLSDYDMNEDVFGSRSGGGIEKTMKKSSVRKRAAKRGFGVETRGN